jgi:YVTN family beta-propeller protein
VVNGGSNNITVIDGATNNTTTVGVGNGPFAAAVNPVMNKIYVVNAGGNVTVIDGVTNNATAVAAGVGPVFAAVNPVTNRIYVSDDVSSGTVTVITEEQVQAIPLTTTITPLAGNITTSQTPSFSFNVASTFAPTAPTPDALYFQFDTVQGPWTAATPNPITPPPDYIGTAPALSAGTHIIYAYATDGQDATSNMTTSNGGSSPLIGAIASYLFTVSPLATGPAVSLNPGTVNFGSQPVGMSATPITVTLTNTGTTNLVFTSVGAPAGTNAGDFVIQTASTCSGGSTVTPNSSCTIVVGFTPSASGARTATITLVDNATNSPQSLNLTGSGTLPPANITATGGTPQSATVSTAFAAPLAVTVTDATNAPVPGITVSFSAPTTGPGGTFAGGVNTAITNANGVATSAVFTANASVGSYMVTATVAGLGASVSFSLTNTAAAAPASITATGGTPQSATIGTAFAAPFVASVKTAAGVPVSGATVTFNTPNASGANGTFPGAAVSYTTTTNANGLATSAVFTANNITGSYAVTAGIFGTNLAANFSLTNNDPTPTLTSISPTSGMVGQPVTLTLTGSNFVSGAIVNFGSNADAGGLESDGTSITITIPASQLTAPGPVNITVSNPAPSAGPSAAQIFTVNGAGLVIGVNGSITVPTSTDSFSFPVQSVGGLAGVLNSYCASPTISCLISPCPTNLKANSSVMMTVTLYSTPQATAILDPRLPMLPGSRGWRIALACLIGLLLVGLLSARKPKVRWAFATAALAFALVGGCGNSGLPHGSAPAGQYTMTITESLGSTTQTSQITLNVQ